MSSLKMAVACLAITAMVAAAPAENLGTEPANLVTLSTRAGGGDPIATYELAIKYASGEGVAQDYVRAAELSQLAADRGFPDAQCFLGHLYEHGLGVPRNDIEALR